MARFRINKTFELGVTTGLDKTNWKATLDEDGLDLWCRETIITGNRYEWQTPLKNDINGEFYFGDFPIYIHVQPIVNGVEGKWFFAGRCFPNEVLPSYDDVKHADTYHPHIESTYDARLNGHLRLDDPIVAPYQPYSGRSES